MIGSLDGAIQQFFSGIGIPALQWLWVFLANWGIYALVLLVVVLLFRIKPVKEKISFFAQSLLVVVLARGLVTETIYFLYNRPRPFESGFDALFSRSGGFSFPSGHTVTMFSLAFVIYAWNKKAGKWALGISILSGLSRSITGVHWFSDVIGGILVSWIVYFLVRRYIHIGASAKSEIEVSHEA